MVNKTVQFVYFDIDDTLLDHRHAERMALGDVCTRFPEFVSKHSLEIVQETYHRFNQMLWAQYSRGEIDRTDLKRLRFEQVLDALTIEGISPIELNDCYLDYYARYWRFIEGAEEAFFRIAAQYPVGVLTNGFAHIQHAKLSFFPELKERLSQIVVSEEVGYLKPNPLLFEHAARLTECDPATILYVGDSYASDVQGALRSGWQMAWYKTDDGQAATGIDDNVFTFTAWPQLLAYLDA